MTSLLIVHSVFNHERDFCQEKKKLKRKKMNKEILPSAFSASIEQSYHFFILSIVCINYTD
jgi:hypothetical protein